MRNHNHARYKILLSFTGVDRKVITDVYYIQEHPLCLERLKNYIKTGTWTGNNARIQTHNGWYDSNSHAASMYEQLPGHISEYFSKMCARDEKYAAIVMAAASQKATAFGESLGTTKAKITRMKNKGESLRLIEHEYYLLVKKYKLFTIVDFDYEEPVCACCGKIYPVKYTLNVDNEAYCFSCANELVNNDTDQSDAEVQLVKKALYEEPDSTFKSSEELINRQIQHFVSAQKEFSQFVHRMAVYYNAGEEDKDILHIYERTWREATIEKFNANISSISNSESADSIDQIASELLVPRFDLEDINILLKQLVK